MAVDDFLSPLKRDEGVEVLNHARDIHMCHELMPETKLLADIKGLATRVHSRGGIMFIQLRDASESIQLVLNKQNFSEDSWKRAKAIRVMDRLHVQGEIGLSKRNVLTVFLFGFRQFLSGSIAQGGDARSVEGPLTVQFFLARLRERAVDYFLKAGYEEFEPSCLSASRGSYLIEPLRVQFPGFGAPSFLSPSPASQLLEAILVAPSPKVFCVSRCFSAEIRDGYTSAESLVLCARQLRATVSEMHNLAQNAVKAIFNHFETMPQRTEAKWLGPSEWPLRDYSPNQLPRRVVEPEIQSLSGSVQNLGISADITNVFRVCWPSDFIIAEGHVETLDERISIGGITLHLERMVPALRDVTLRRLRHL